MLDANGVRGAIQRLRAQVEDRSIAASELSGYTISLSNFGMFAGRYATPVVVPPTVAIVGAGKLSNDVVAVIGGIEVHRRMPISLTFDHRAATGGEAARFLKALQLGRDTSELQSLMRNSSAVFCMKKTHTKINK